MVHLVSVYAPDDEPLHEELRRHVVSALAGTAVVWWYPGRIPIGDDVETQWQHNLRQADLILLLASASLEGGCEQRIPAALEQLARGATILPILLRPFVWRAAAYARLQLMPRDGNAVTAHGPTSLERDHAWMEIAAEICTRIQVIGAAGCAASTVDPQRFYEALCRLDFKEQLRPARAHLARSPVGAFLVHGPDRHGQRWVVNRILDSLLASSDGPRRPVRFIRFDAARKGRNTGAIDLWREVASRMGLDRLAPRQDVSRRVAGCAQTQHVVLWVDNVHHLTETVLTQIIGEFWLFLAEAAPAAAGKIILFLLDHDGCTAGWRLSESGGGAAPGPAPVRLPSLDRWSALLVEDWILDEEHLPQKWRGTAQQTAQEVLQASDNGVPEDVFAALCRRCGEDWSAREEEWMRFR